MRIIPDSLWESLAVGRVVASARSTDAGRRRRPRWTRLSSSNRLRSRSSPPDEDRGRSSPRNRRRPARRHRPGRRSPSAPAARSRPSAPGYRPALHGHRPEKKRGRPAERPRPARARRIRADGTISGPAAGYRDQAQPPAPAAPARRAPLFRPSMTLVSPPPDVLGPKYE